MKPATLRALAILVLFNVALMVACGGSSGGSNNGNAVQPPSITITSVAVSCTPTSLTAGQTSQCAATVNGSGSYSSAVVWSASTGSISNSGLFDSKGVDGGTKITITATSLQDTSKSGTATVSIDNSISSLSVSCTVQFLHPGDISQCTATVNGTGNFNSGVTWSTQVLSDGSDCNCVSPSGTFTAPRVDGASQVSIIARSVQDVTKAASYNVYVSLTGTVTGVTVSCAKTTIYAGQASFCSAQVTGTGDYSSTVRWNAYGSGSMADTDPGLYLSNSRTNQTETETIQAASVQSGTSGETTIIVKPYDIQPNNVSPLIVDAGPAGSYVNGSFTSVTVCVTGTYTCQTIDHVLVDTGSSGLRLLSTAAGGQFDLALLQEKIGPPYFAPTPLVECAQFVSGYLWGPVMRADILTLPDGSGEEGDYTLMQVVGPAGEPGVPASCSNTGTDLSTLQAMGANGILGVGLFLDDCGDLCHASDLPNMYYACADTGCSQVSNSTQQVQNPVARFGTDNNGTILQLPAVTPPGTQTVSGSLIYGINTQANNALGSAQVFTADNQTGTISVKYGGVSYPVSFIDSGSNATFFLNSKTLGSGMPTCNGFYCPNSTQNFTATNVGTNTTTGDVNFNIDSADQLFGNNNSAVPTLGGPFDLGDVIGFDWGLPFFYGRRVYTGIEGSSLALFFAY